MIALSAIRRSRGLSQHQLAEALGLRNGASYISRIENGHMVPTVSIAKKIAEVLGVTIEDLLGEPFEPKAVGDRTSPSPARPPAAGPPPSTAPAPRHRGGTRK